MRDLLYYYCGGNVDAVLELVVSLHSLLKSNPNRSFDIGVALDAQAADILDWRPLVDELGIAVRILESGPANGKCEWHTHHVVNRWQGLERFDYDRAMILDIDTLVNRPIDSLFDHVHPNPEYFTTFVAFSERVRGWHRHQRFYDSLGCEYDRKPLYCAIGLHAISRGWPHTTQMQSYLRAMDDFKRRHRIRRAFVEEFSVNLILMQNGRKIHFPFAAMRKGKLSTNSGTDQPYVWHFVLGRSRDNPIWQQALAEAKQMQFLNVCSLS